MYRYVDISMYCTVAEWGVWYLDILRRDGARRQLGISCSWLRPGWWRGREERTSPRQWHAVTPRSRPRPHTSTAHRVTWGYRGYVSRPGCLCQKRLEMDTSKRNAFKSILSYWFLIMGSCAYNYSLFIGLEHCIKRNPNIFSVRDRCYDISPSLW